ncbi:MAG: type IV pilus assembly protein PilM [Pseudobdellovibrionaceae bacterium]
MLFGSKKLIGLDIGTSTIKMAEMDVSGSKVQLLSFGFAPTPVGSLNSGEILNPGAISGAVKALATEMKTKLKKVSTGLWGTGVIVKKITIPRIEKKMIAEQLQWEAEQYLPFDINTISLGFHVINPNAANETMDILLIAAQHEIVNQYRNSVIGANLQLNILDVSGFALANLFEANYGKNDETIGLINIGSGVTNFVVVMNGEVIFSRDVAIGGFNFTNEISKEMGVTLPEAESLKLSASNRGAVPDEVHSILSSTNDLITDEIRNSFEFFVGSNNGAAFNRCFVTGGSSSVPGLLEKVSQATSVQIEKLNPFLRIKASKNFSEAYLRQIAPFASVAMGLGLRRVGDS